jgi:hypothetical protein
VCGALSSRLEIFLAQSSGGQGGQLDSRFDPAWGNASRAGRWPVPASQPPGPNHIQIQNLGCAARLVANWQATSSSRFSARKQAVPNESDATSKSISPHQNPAGARRRKNPAAIFLGMMMASAFALIIFVIAGRKASFLPFGWPLSKQLESAFGFRTMAACPN